MPVLYKSIDLICRVTKIIEFMFHSLCVHMCFVLTIQWKIRTELTQHFKFHFYLRTHYTNTLYLQFTDE